MRGQATEVQALLRRKVKAWAYSSRGMFRLMPLVGDNSSMSNLGEGEWAMWSKARTDKQLEKRMMFGELKAPERSIAKCLTRYDRQMRRLVSDCPRKTA